MCKDHTLTDAYSNTQEKMSQLSIKHFFFYSVSKASKNISVYLSRGSNSQGEERICRNAGGIKRGVSTRVEASATEKVSNNRENRDREENNHSRNQRRCPSDAMKPGCGNNRRRL